MGLARTTHIVHLIDFGLSRKYRDAKTHQHIPYKKKSDWNCWLCIDQLSSWYRAVSQEDLEQISVC